MTLAAGSQLGPYVIGARIGAGGMGEVYRARDVRLDRDVAIKVLPEELFGDADHVARFEREAKALAALNHPGIAAIHSFEEVGGRHLLVQELLEGETLRHVLLSGKIPLRKTLDYAVQIVKALAAAHEKGVVHRDLKPENLFVTSNGRVKILDFGLAKLTKPQEDSGATNLPTVSRSTEPGVVLGTLGYMSPEQVRGKPADPRSDIFSFGSILYEMLSGKRPFTGDSAADTMSAILKEDPPDLAVTGQSIPPGLERIVRHCLEKSPEQRFHSAHDLAFDLEALSAVSTPRLSPSAAGISARRLPSRAVAVAAFASLAVGLLVGWQAFRTRPAEPPRFQRLTFRRGPIRSARFAPDGQTIVYSAQWDGAKKPQLHSMRLESPESSRLNLPEREVRSISRTGELLLLELRRFSPFSGYSTTGMLSQAPISGSAARDLVEDVADADWSPDGTTFAVVRAPDWHYRLEFPTGKVLCETTGWISHPRVSPKGDLVAFLEHPVLGSGGGSVAVVDREGKKKKKTLTTDWDSLQGLAWSPSGDELWFSAAASGNAKALHAVSLSGRHRAVASTPAGLNLEDISCDGRVLFVERNGSLGLLGLLPAETSARDLSLLDWPVSPLLSSDGKTLVFTEYGQGGGPAASIYMRRLDGSPAESAVRLGEGLAVALSSDGRWVLQMLVASNPPRLQLLPTGAGEHKPLPEPGVDFAGGNFFGFFPDAKRVIFVAHEPGRPLRTFVQDLSGGAARPVTPEVVTARLLSPDGRSVVIQTPENRFALLPLAGGEAQPIAGVEPGDTPLGWAADGRSLFVNAGGMELFGARVIRIDGASGRRDLWKEYTPRDMAGLTLMQPAAISADGKTLIVHYQTVLSILYLGEGIR